jgi:ABC-2 type transport system ATP-binding protein
VHVITVSGLRFSYGAVPAVDGVSFEVRAGEIFGLLGPNGAGKSTTIHCIGGVLSPSGGEVRLDGGDPRDARVRRRLGVAPQALSLYEDLTGEENCAFFGRLNGLASRSLKERTVRALDLAGLSDRARDRVSAYSGGMKRRLNLAVALLHDPPVLLLDEPTVGVDPQSRNHLFDSIEALRGEGRAILYTTHYMEEAQRLCDRVAVMDRGRIMDLGTVDDLLARHGGPSVVEVDGLDRSVAVEPLGGTRDGEVSRFESPNPMTLLQTLADRKAAYTGLRIHRADLETVFLNLTGRRLRD